MLPTDLFQDRKGSQSDFLNARIYVSDRASPEEIAAAANVSARLTFEIQSLDLPIGFPMSEYSNSDPSVAIVIGSAASKFADLAGASIRVQTDGSRSIVAISDLRDAERFARTLGSPLEIDFNLEDTVGPREKSFSLSSLFNAEGLLGDGDGDWIPELVETTIVLGADVHSISVIDLAARIALEGAGIRIPLVVTDNVDRLPPNPVLIGRSNRYLKEFGEFSHQLRTLRPGQGRVEVARPANGNSSAVLIAGADAAGEAAAVSHAAERLPFAWRYGKEYLHLSKIEKDLRGFFSLRASSGQAAAALCKAREHIARLSIAEAANARLEILVSGDCRPSLDYIHSQFPGIQVTAECLTTESGPLVFEDEYPLPWEGDDARRLLMNQAAAAIRPGSSVHIDLRISESPAIRATMKREICEIALELGADPSKLQVQVHAAHKQAFCWIDELLKPQLKNADRIRIRYQEIAPNGDFVIESPNRWLQELYPIDEVLSRDLGISVDHILFEKGNSDQPATYEVMATDRSGFLILQETFEPRFAMRPMFDSFPDYARVRVNTGWLHATVDGVVASDERIETDPERFWNLYQSQTLPKIREYLMRLYDGNPIPECAPHFNTLEVELWLSEPDYRIGIGEERISTLDALHEDIYFETLLFFEILGLQNPGRIIPRVHSARDGQSGMARIRFIGKAGPNPRVDLRWIDSHGVAHRQTDNLFPIPDLYPKITALTVQAEHSAVVSLEMRGVSDSPENQALLGVIQEFHRAGVGTNWLSYTDIDALQFGSVRIHRTAACTERQQIGDLPESARPLKDSIVQWDTPIGPAECGQIIRRLAAFPEIRTFQAGTSYLGHPIWALEVSTPSKGRYISQARSIVTKPVIFITGRQHANEVSSTSHILRLAELLATDPETHKLLDHVHFLLQPITNPDGAALVDELRRDTPDFLLHAGYLGALGSDVTIQQWFENPIYPEASVRTELWKMWLPDIVLNPHGYPSHEWVQLFAGYTAWVKSRSVTARDWWIPRGWFIPEFIYMESSRDTAMKVCDRTTAEMRSLLGAWNSQMYRRYAKYGTHDPSTFKLQLCNELLVNAAPKGLFQKENGFTFMQRYPQVTLLEIVSEAPDEVAQGDWLKTLAHAGLEFSLAHARYLAETRVEPVRTVHHSKHSTTLKIQRRRPGQAGR